MAEKARERDDHIAGWMRATPARTHPETTTPHPPGGAETAARAVRQKLDRLAEAAHTAAPGLGLAGIHTPPRTQTQASGLDTSCDHWFDRIDDPEHPEDRDNRMLWWKRRPRPGTDPEQLSGVRNEFICAFHPLLRHVVEWGSFADGRSPNEVPGLGFTVVPASPDMVPVLRQIDGLEAWTAATSQQGKNTGTQPVLVNALSQHAVLQPGTSWPDLLLVFDVPQVEVGFEYGFADPSGTVHSIVTQSAARLLAFDRDGNLVARSLPQPAIDQFFQRSGEVTTMIGVRSPDGNIASVRLRFDRAVPEDGLQDAPLRLPQLVRRVWHASFPSSAVVEGSARLRNVDGAVTRTPWQDRLPFACDEAAVFLRGFKLQYTAPPARPSMDHPSVSVRLDRTPGSRIVSVQAEGHLGRFDEEITVYFTLVAWDSLRVRLRTSEGARTVWNAFETGSPILQRHLLADDPWPEGSTLPRGPVFAAPTKLEWRVPIDSPQRLAFYGGLAGRQAGTGSLDWLFALSHWQPTGNRLSNFQQNVHATFLTGPDLHSSVGTVFSLQDRSLVQSEDGIFPDRLPSPESEIINAAILFTPPNAGARVPDPTNPRHWPVSVDFERTSQFQPRLSVPARAQMAFVGLRGFTMEIGGLVRELEVELSAGTYDGERVFWRYGYGISRETAPGRPDEGLPAVQVAFAVGSILEHSESGTEDFAIAETIFDARPGTIAAEPRQFGALINLGDRPIRIWRAALAGADASEFDVVIGVATNATSPWGFAPSLRGREVLTIDAFNAHIPLRLMPGDALVIGGRCFPTADGERSASLVFSTNLLLSPTIAVPLFNRPTDQPALAEVVPSTVAFHDVALHHTATASATILATGAVPVVVNAIRLASGAMIQPPGAPPLASHPSPFSVSLQSLTQGGVHDLPAIGRFARWQIDPGNGLFLQLHFRPNVARQESETLLVETDNGLFSIPVFGRGI